MKLDWQSKHRNTGSRPCTSRDFPIIVGNSHSSSGQDRLKLGAAARNPLAANNPAKSIRVPVTPENRIYLRKAREAEMALWARPGNTPHSTKSTSSLPLGVEKNDLRAETLAFVLLGALSLASVAFALTDSAYLLDRCSAFVRLALLAVQ